MAYTEKPDSLSFMREWMALVESGSGERGVFNREASKKQAAKFERRDPSYDFGTNPCSEIILRPYQFCNLTEVVVRATDNFGDLARKVKIATTLGTIQSTYTKFPYLRKIWKDNTEEERLLGVSLTGIMDNPLLTSKQNGLSKNLKVLGKWQLIRIVLWLIILVLIIPLLLPVSNLQEPSVNLLTVPQVSTHVIPDNT